MIEKIEHQVASADGSCSFESGIKGGSPFSRLSWVGIYKLFNIDFGCIKDFAHSRILALPAP
jgi:hypothetical protein